MQILGLCRHYVLLVLIVAATLAGVGCDRTDQVIKTSRDEQSGQRLISTNLSPKGVLEEVKRRYRELTSYEDRGVVRLRYQLNGRILVDEAPMSIAWDNQGNLGLRVYSVVAGPSDGRWQLRLSEPQQIDDAATEVDAQPSLAQQVLSRAIPEQVDYSWLLSDPLVGQALAAGMAGFPPQLDLLLSPAPLSGLIDDSAALGFGEPAMIGDDLCQIVIIERPGLTYRLWIEQSRGLLRRIEVPEGNIPPQILQDQRVSQVRLSIEFEGVRTNQPIDWKNYAVASRANDLLVKQFTTPPPTLDRWQLGEKFPAFTLRDEAGQESFQGGQRSTKAITILTWLADHATCRVTLDQLARIEEQFSAPEWSGRVNFVSVWAAPQPPPGLSFQTLRQQWKLPGVFAVDREAVGRDVFQVYEAPTVIVLDSENRLQARWVRVQPDLEQSLPMMIEQLAQGINVAEQVIESDRFLQAHYVANLAMSSAEDSARANLPESYPAALFALKETATIKLPVVPRAVGSHDQRVWLLMHDGELQSRSLSDGPVDRWSTEWKITANPSGQYDASLHLAPDGSCAALLSDGNGRLRVLNLNNRQSSELQLQPNTKVVDLRWLTLDRAHGPRLAVIDSLSRTTLFDPQNHEQLTGQCPAPPLAILPATFGTTADAGVVVLANGQLEGLQLSEESTLRNNLVDSAMQKQPTTQRQLAFRAGAALWVAWQGADASSTLVLANGWIAKGEPAWFLIDREFKPVWHSPKPLASPSVGMLATVATDPATGQAIWATSVVDRTVHLLRADGIVDHFRVADTILGLALIPMGTRLSLVLVHQDRMQSYELYPSGVTP